jgi:hypothetical protein
LVIPANTKPLLGFHNISSSFDFSANSISPVSFSSIIAFLQSNHPGTQLLFDDGFNSILPFSDDLSAFSPLMSIITGFIGAESSWDFRLGGSGKSHLTKNQILKLSDKGWTILSHTKTHRALDILPDTEIKSELIESKMTIENVTGKKCSGLSFPFGRYNNKVLDIALSAGYEHFYSNRLGLEHPKVNQVYSVYRWDGVNSVIRKLQKNKYEKMKLQLINYCSAGTVFMQKTAGYGKV